MPEDRFLGVEIEKLWKVEFWRYLQKVATLPRKWKNDLKNLLVPLLFLIPPRTPGGLGFRPKPALQANPRSHSNVKSLVQYEWFPENPPHRPVILHQWHLDPPFSEPKWRFWPSADSFQERHQSLQGFTNFRFQLYQIQGPNSGENQPEPPCNRPKFATAAQPRNPALQPRIPLLRQ